MKEKKWAIIGGGNGGQALAGHLALLGKRVRLYDKFKVTVDSINKIGGISLYNALKGFGKIEFATTDIAEAINGADNIIIVLPSIYHEEVARECIPNLKDGQVVLLHPEASCGALAFYNLMKDYNCAARIILGSTNTLLYACRCDYPGHVNIFGLKHQVAMAALPSSDNATLEKAISTTLPWLKVSSNVLFTSLANPNAIMHPAPMIFNVSRIEAEPHQDFEYYRDGITKSIGNFIEKMDIERIAIADEFALKIPSIKQDSIMMYDFNDTNNTIYSICKNSSAHKGIMAPKTIKMRYLLEDIPYSLVPIQSLAKVVNIKTPYIDSIVGIGYLLFNGKLDAGRTPKVLGIEGMKKRDLLSLIS